MVHRQEQADVEHQEPLDVAPQGHQERSAQEVERMEPGLQRKRQPQAPTWSCGQEVE